MISYDFHPMTFTRKSVATLTRFWDFIGADNPEAADRLIAEIVDAMDFTRRRAPPLGQQAATSHQMKLTTDNIRFTVYSDD